MRTSRSCIGLLLSLGLAGCGSSDPPASQPPPAKPDGTTTPSSAVSADHEDDTLAGLDSLIGGLDPEKRPLEPWPLEAAPADWKARSASVPLVAGLTAIVSVQEPRGDYETVKHVQSIEKDRVNLSFSLRSGAVSGVTSLRGRRVVPLKDMAEAHGYNMTFSSGGPEMFPGMTALGVSAAVYRELVDPGRSQLDLLAGADLVGTMLALGDALSSDLTGELVRAGADPEPLPVLVNGERTWLPAVHAKGEFQGIVRTVMAEFWFLDDANNPLTLRAQVDRARLQVVRIDFPADQAGTSLERALADGRPVEMWGVYFEFASAQLQPESGPVLDEVAGVLGRHPDWKLRVEGHTDDVGDDAANLDLSRSRAQAVRAELERRLGENGAQISAAGFGEARPREPNDTLSGRARNRRVELIRE